MTAKGDDESQGEGGHAAKANPPVRKPRRCPACGKPAQQRFRPFCSATCRDRDLLHWLKGAYAVPAVESGDDSDEPDDGAA